MMFLTSAILSGIIYDLIKSGIRNIGIDLINSRVNYIRFSQEMIGDLLDEINTLSSCDEKIKRIESYLSNDSVMARQIENEIYPTNFAKRLDYVLLLINRSGPNFTKYNIEKLAYEIGFKSVNDIKKYYTCHEEPLFSFVSQISDYCGINPEWMISGTIEESPFESKLPKKEYGYELISTKEYIEAERVFIVMKDVEYDRTIAVIRKMNKIKYEYFPKELILYDGGGFGGQGRLYSTYLMLKEMSKQHRLPDTVYLISEEMFYLLLKGKIYPGAVLQGKNEPNMLEDFLWISSERFDNYQNWYGKSFVDAQQCIIKMSEDRKSSTMSTKN